MTIRRYLLRRRRLFGAALLAWAVSGLVIVHRSGAAVLAWAIAAALILMAQFWLSRCPRCGIFISTAYVVGGKRWLGPINFCPGCGVSLDEPVHS